MRILRKSRTLVAWPLIAAMLAFSMPIGVAQAALVGTDQVIAQAGIAADRALVAAFLARQDVRDEFARQGVSPDEASARVAGLSDAEIARFADRIDGMPAGQGAMGAVVGAVVLIAIILFVTDLFGVTDVYPFVDPLKK